MIALHDSVNIPHTVFAQEVDGEMVILDTASKEYFGLDATGAVIWQHLSENGALQEVFETMLEMYDVDARQLETDISRFTQELLDAGLVQKP